MKQPSIHGIYAITASSLFDCQEFTKKITYAIQGGAALIQYRDKQSNPSQRLHRAQALLTVCRANNIPLIINDDIELAKVIGAGGIHLGRQDADVKLARQTLGADSIIGCSCYDDIELAIDAQNSGADYVSFGCFYPSQTKPEAAPTHLEILSMAKSKLNIAIIAIGGIRPGNAKPLIDAGADALAIVDGIFGQPDPREATQKYVSLYKSNTSGSPLLFPH